MKEMLVPPLHSHPQQASLFAVNKICLARHIFRFLAVFRKLEKKETPFNCLKTNLRIEPSLINQSFSQWKASPKVSDMPSPSQDRRISYLGSGHLFVHGEFC